MKSKRSYLHIQKLYHSGVDRIYGSETITTLCDKKIRYHWTTSTTSIAKFLEVMKNNPHHICAGCVEVIANIIEEYYALLHS